MAEQGPAGQEAAQQKPMDAATALARAGELKRTVNDRSRWYVRSR